jgi:hypothetical protein
MKQDLIITKQEELILHYKKQLPLKGAISQYVWEKEKLKIESELASLKQEPQEKETLRDELIRFLKQLEEYDFFSNESAEKIIDIPTITTTDFEIKRSESDQDKRCENCDRSIPCNLECDVVNKVMEHAIKKAGKRKTEPIKSAEEILKNHFNPKHVIWAAGTTSQTIIMIMLEYAGQFRQKEVPLTAEEISLKDKILEEAKNGNIVVSTFEGLMAYSLKEVVEQPISGLLYDLNRDQATILTFINDPKWVNDYACYQVICELKSRLEASQFQPKEIVLPSDEEINKACPQELLPRISCWIQGAKWLRNLIEEQKKK